jgi:hypothetical protein
LCAARISERRREELTSLVEKHIAAGGTVWMTTYTIAQHRCDDLSELLTRFLAPWRGAAAQLSGDRDGVGAGSHLVKRKRLASPRA